MIRMDPVLGCRIETLRNSGNFQLLKASEICTKLAVHRSGFYLTHLSHLPEKLCSFIADVVVPKTECDERL